MNAAAVGDVDVSFCSTIPSVILHNGMTSWPVLYVVEFCISLLPKLDAYPRNQPYVVKINIIFTRKAMS